MPFFGRIITRYQKEEQLCEGDPILIVGALLGSVIVNTMLRSADANALVPPIAAAIAQYAGFGSAVG